MPGCAAISISGLDVALSVHIFVCNTTCEKYRCKFIMKEKFVTLISILLSISFFAQANSPSNFSVDVTSAKLYLDMSNKANKGQMPSDEEWNTLFSSPAYVELFNRVNWDKEEFQSNVREAFNLAYNPLKANERDSIAAMFNDIELATLDSELPLFLSTAMSIKENLATYTETINNIDIDKVIADANNLALSLLPNRGEGITPEPCPIYFIVWDLECRSLGDALFLDVNTFFYDGLQTATEALAHEMHHFYLMPVFNTVYKEDVMDGAIFALVQNMREGVADILNKKEMPLKSLAPYGEKMLATYNEDYAASPQILEKLDAVTCEYLDGKLNMEQYIRAAIKCARYGGHTTGDFMVFLIRDQLGRDAVVECVGNVENFVDNYNKAAAKAGTYQFSDRFTKHIHDICSPARR